MLQRLFIGLVSALALGAAIAYAQLVPQPGPPTPVACAYNATPPTVTSGNAVWLQCDSSGQLLVGGGIATGTAANPATTGVVSEVQLPSSAAAAAIAPVVSSATEACHVMKAGAGNFYSLTATNGASAGWVLIFDATAAPADGAVTPKWWATLAANSTLDKQWFSPLRFATGMTVCFSTTGPFTKTASATAAFSAAVQ